MRENQNRKRKVKECGVSKNRLVNHSSVIRKIFLLDKHQIHNGRFQSHTHKISQSKQTSHIHIFFNKHLRLIQKNLRFTKIQTKVETHTQTLTSANSNLFSVELSRLHLYKLGMIVKKALFSYKNPPRDGRNRKAFGF